MVGSSHYFDTLTEYLFTREDKEWGMVWSQCGTDLSAPKINKSVDNTSTPTSSQCSFIVIDESGSQQHKIGGFV